MSYRAVVPLLGLPTMKKSGNPGRTSLDSARASVEVLIAPEADEVASQIFTQGDDLRAEAMTQLRHELGVFGCRLSVYEPVLRRSQGVAAKPARCQRLDRRLGPTRQRSAPHRQRMHGAVQALRAHPPPRRGA